MSLKHTVLVTGAGSGLGRGLCVCLAKSGWDVIATDKDAEGIEQTCAMLSNDVAARVLRLDVTSQAEIDGILQTLGAQSVDVLINNAGLQHVAPIESFPQDIWNRLISVMLHGTCMLTRAVLPGMRERGFGRIINIGSIHSVVASPYKSAYVAAKHAVVGFSRAIALETADTDITINTICPSYIRTPLVESQIVDQADAHGISEDEVIEKIMLQPMPKKAFITVEEIAATVRFLTGHDARNITGQTIIIDGGWTIR